MQTARKFTNEYVAISQEAKRNAVRRKSKNGKVIYISDRMAKYNNNTNAYSYYKEVNGYGEIAVPMPHSPSKQRKEKRKEFVSPKIDTSVKTHKHTSAKAHPQTAAAPKAAAGVFSTIMIIAVVFALLCVVLTGNAKISEVTLANSQIASEIESIQDNIDKTKLDIALNQDLGEIQTRASALGMKAPAANQIVYVAAEPEAADTAQVLISSENTANEENQISFDSVIKYIKNLLE